MEGDDPVISRLFRPDPEERAVQHLYARLVERSRAPEFYLNCGVPDSLDGRFDMLVLHIFMILDRLAGRGEREDALVQALIDRLFADMDETLREMGVGDLSVGKKVKRMAEAFYGRSRAYREGLASEDGDALADALRRNLYRAAEGTPSQVSEMADYIRRECAMLAEQPVDALLAEDGPRFGPPPR